jgi:uncharacterized membrane protein YhaH (DUF805 family)
MNPIEGYRNYMMRAGRIRERMTRAEFWPSFLFNLLLMFLFEVYIRPHAFALNSFFDAVVFGLVLVFTLGPIIQRVNDANLRKRFLLCLLIPYGGIAIVGYMLIQKSYPATTEYGPCRA